MSDHPHDPAFEAFWDALPDNIPTQPKRVARLAWDAALLAQPVTEKDLADYVNAPIVRLHRSGPLPDRPGWFYGRAQHTEQTHPWRVVETPGAGLRVECPTTLMDPARFDWFGQVPTCVPETPHDEAAAVAGRESRP